MKHLNFFLFALLMVIAPHVAFATGQNPQPAATFSTAFADWKSEFSMSAFTREEDTAILLRSRSGDCGIHIFFMDVIAEMHMTLPLPQKRSSKYYTRMENFYDICQVTRKSK